MNSIRLTVLCCLSGLSLLFSSCQKENFTPIVEVPPSLYMDFRNYGSPVILGGPGLNIYLLDKANMAIDSLTGILSFELSIEHFNRKYPGKKKYQQLSDFNYAIQVMNTARIDTIKDISYIQVYTPSSCSNCSSSAHAEVLEYKHYSYTYNNKRYEFTSNIVMIEK